MIGENDIRRAAESVLNTWSDGIDGDWSQPAGELEWNCAGTAEHVSDVLFSYAAQVASGAPSAYVRLLLRAEDEATPGDLIEGVRATAGMLAAVVARADPGSRAYHPSGMADPEGFAAMGVTELLLHGDDVAAGLGLPFEPPEELAAAVLPRLFPEVAVDAEPWLVLRWATGRAELPGRARVQDWRWHGAPLSD